MSLSERRGVFDRPRGSEDDPPQLQLPSRRGCTWPLRDLANEQRRFGYRRLLVLLRREDEPSESTGSTGLIGRKGSPSASDEPAARPWGPGLDPGGS